MYGYVLRKWCAPGPGRLVGFLSRAEEGPVVLVTGFPAEAFGTNCYVVAVGPGEQCLVVDPGIGVEEQLDALLRLSLIHI